VRLTKVTGMPVVDTHVARQAGIVSDVLLDLQAGRVAVLNVKHADGWLVQRIPAEYVYRLGPHTVLVADTVAVDLGPAVADQRWYPIESVVGLDVLTEGGDRVGQISDADLDDQTLAVKAYLLRHAEGPWKRRGRVHPDEVVTCSGELMLIRESARK
jgi:sporulation protein YlmC with PRC-barrel domain